MRKIVIALALLVLFVERVSHYLRILKYRSDFQKSLTEWEERPHVHLDNHPQ